MRKPFWLTSEYKELSERRRLLYNAFENATLKCRDINNRPDNAKELSDEAWFNFHEMCDIIQEKQNEYEKL